MPTFFTKSLNKCLGRKVSNYVFTVVLGIITMSIDEMNLIRDFFKFPFFRVYHRRFSSVDFSSY